MNFWVQIFRSYKAVIISNTELLRNRRACCIICVQKREGVPCLDADPAVITHYTTPRSPHTMKNNFFLKQRNWTLQRQCHEIFDLWIFFQHTIPSRSLIHALKYLRKNKQICVVPHLYRVCRSRAMQHCVGPWFSAMPHSAGSNFLAMDQLGLLWTHSV
jgi:hypothetical protein